MFQFLESKMSQTRLRNDSRLKFRTFYLWQLYDLEKEGCYRRFNIQYYLMQPEITQIGGSVQYCNISLANALDILQLCCKLSVYSSNSPQYGNYAIWDVYLPVSLSSQTVIMIWYASNGITFNNCFNFIISRYQYVGAKKTNVHCFFIGNISLFH